MRHLLLLLTLTCIFGCVREATGCLFLLNGGPSQRRRLSAGERAERAEVVLVASVLGQRSAGDRAGYAVLCQVAEVLKGARQVPRRLLWVGGFGSPVKCLAEARPGHDYIMFLRPTDAANETLVARYDDVSGAVAEYNSHNVKAVETALGWRSWETWTPCNKTCDVGGRVRSRSCEAPPCDYGDQRQEEACSVWSCDKTTILDVRGSPPRRPELRRQKLRSTSVVLTSQLPDSGAAAMVTISMELKIAELGKNMQLVQLEALGIKLHIDIDNEQEQVKAKLNGRQLAISPIDMTIGSLHHMLLILNNSSASLHWDCREVLKVTFVIENLLKGATLRIGPGFSGSISNILQITDADVTSSCIRFPRPKTLQMMFSAWSACTATCGEAVQERYARCRQGGTTCLVGTEYEANSGVQTRACTGLPPCEQWKAGSDCSGSTQCLNGGLCMRGQCICSVGFEGKLCERGLCSPNCKNGGRCLSRNKCSCPVGWRGRACGRRVGGNGNSSKKRKKKSRCARPCQNKGQCVNGQCVCPLGYRGKRCHRAICLPKCKNRGRCIHPNLCKCAGGYTGQSCEKVECFPSCMNGGKCAKPGKCQCKPHFSGKFCQRVKCRRLCLNGGRCSPQGVCRCGAGFFGALCQSRRCIKQLKYRTVYKPTLRSFKEDDYYLCYRKRRVKLCRRKKWKSVVVYKIVLKPHFQCTG